MTKCPGTASKAEPITRSPCDSDSPRLTRPAVFQPGACGLFVRTGAISHEDCETARTCRVQKVFGKSGYRLTIFGILSFRRTMRLGSAQSPRCGRNSRARRNPLLVASIFTGPFAEPNVIRRNDEMTEVIADHGSTALFASRLSSSWCDLLSTMVLPPTIASDLVAVCGRCLTLHTVSLAGGTRSRVPPRSASALC